MVRSVVAAGLSIGGFSPESLIDSVPGESWTTVHLTFIRLPVPDAASDGANFAVSGL